MFYLVAQEFGLDVDKVKAWPISKTVKHVLFLERQNEMLKEETPKIPDMPQMPKKGAKAAKPKGFNKMQHSGRQLHAYHFKKP